MIDSPRHDDVLTTRTEPADLATHWPQFSERELARLGFLTYRRQTRRIGPPAPVWWVGGYSPREWCRNGPGPRSRPPGRARARVDNKATVCFQRSGWRF